MSKCSELNDKLRRTMLVNQSSNKVMFTSGFIALSEDTKFEVIRLIIQYNDFNENNDPYEEHDMVFVTYKKQKFMCKIDYYDKIKIGFGAEDPSNEETTLRVLTIMLGEEY